jgi:hypothetical protein
MTGWLLGMVLAAALPGVALVALVTYAALRLRWPDRLVAWLLVAAAAPVGALVVWKTDYVGRWCAVAVDWWLRDQPPAPADWLAVVATGAAVGPVLGAVIWRISQHRRERAPFRGEDERERRLRTEESRRKRVTQAAQRARGHRFAGHLVRPLAVPSGDELGPFLGVFQRGDLGGPFRAGTGRRLVRLPMCHRERGQLVVGSPSNRHLVVLGATGTGKTETILTICEWAIRRRWQVIYVSGKEPPNLRKSVAPRLTQTANRVGARVRVLAQNTGPFDPMRGSTDDIRDRLIRIEEWREPYYQHLANLLCALALDLNAAAGNPISAFPDLVSYLVESELRRLAKTSNDPRVDRLVRAMDHRQLSGALTRYASVAVFLRSWIGPPEAGGWAWEDADLAVVELPTSRQPEAAGVLMRLMLRDLAHYVADGGRRHQVDGNDRPLLIVVEEVSAVAGDEVIGRELLNQVERNRSANAFTVVSAQGPEGLGDEQAQDSLLANCSTLTYRQARKAEMLAELAGTRRRAEAGADYDTDGRYTDKGVARMQDAFKAHPNLLRSIGLGEFVLINSNRYLLAAAAMSGPEPVPAPRLPQLPAAPKLELPAPEPVDGDDQAVELAERDEPFDHRGEL